MHYRRLGRSGIKVSEISLGAWLTFGSQISDQTASDLVHAAYDQGVNFFDNSDVYAKGKAEEVLGKAIVNIARETVVISRISSGVFFCTFFSFFPIFITFYLPLLNNEITEHPG